MALFSTPITPTAPPVSPVAAGALRAPPRLPWRLPLPWLLFAAALVCAPLLLRGPVALSLLTQMATVALFGLSYNMLLGQGGMLSFGHAVYAGLGAYVAAHAMNLGAAGTIPLPVVAVPLVGGVAGMVFGLLFGYLSTKKAGTTFSMITLGIVELVFACALMFPGFFGGEGGISTNRVYGAVPLGLNFAPQLQVYGLAAAWLFVCAAAMYGFTQSPLGKIINAVRDNPERVAFIGYDPRWARYLTLVVSSLFAGVSGALSAINFEIVTAENVGAARSGAILLFTFIGGVGYFFGPVLGAVIGVAATVLLSEVTQAWQLYLGVFFILTVMFVPGGAAELLAGMGRHLAGGSWRRTGPAFALLLAALAWLATAFVALVETVYQASLGPMGALPRGLAALQGPAGWIAIGTALALGLFAVARAHAALREALACEAAGAARASGEGA
ncbi:ABC-type branched-chain amino acid transport system, permease component [Acidovorax sp. CF316]|uniref:branched-chain amino acid ABC transporter permease n=1 Tax=Acidovorax sp. CF316 TaxID=1144317 RepID=UPI00026BDC31|nr:branched-chain amino acid ABC transporter permease [Acidovorax sp. CF316]EJE48867.1 ABC-type branched-chain amino acid transport system, permease component [Acidovorax sp. CF316]